MNTGKMIKKLRCQRKMTQQQLADALGVSKPSVQKYEQGDVLNLKAATLRKLCDLFDVPPWAFVFPEYVTDETTNLYSWREIKEFLIIFNKLDDVSRIKAAEYLRDLHIIEKYRNEKE